MGEDPDEYFIALYADDITIIHWGNTPGDAAKRQREVWEKLQKYFRKNSLIVNVGKPQCLWCPPRPDNTFLRWVMPSSVTRFARRHSYQTLVQPTLQNPTPNLANIKTVVPAKEIMRILGVIYNEQHTFKEHVEILLARLKRRVHIFRRITSLSWGSNVRLLTTMFKGLIQNVIGYGITAWGSYVPGNVI